jgi:hypothetical protein
VILKLILVLLGFLDFEEEIEGTLKNRAKSGGQNSPVM